MILPFTKLQRVALKEEGVDIRRWADWTGTMESSPGATNSRFGRGKALNGDKSTGETYQPYFPIKTS
ncbi:hypothetical protein V2G26_005757 [Clonostachys chloroleuca]